MNICITGSLGLIGSTASIHFLDGGNSVTGIDNNMRQVFFGKEGSSKGQLSQLSNYGRYIHSKVDIRNRDKIMALFKKRSFDVIIHTAAQPSHDKAKEIPILDFEINTLGTLNLLEAMRLYSPQAVFIFMSTNKVYGDNPNKVPLRELKTRYAFSTKKFNGFSEELRTDHCIHSLFGASKLAADTYVQEYGNYYGLKTTCFRLGCVTGKVHAGVKLHGFLSYIVKSLYHQQKYQIIGYKGKQVRDQIHAEDVLFACREIIRNPKKGKVYNLGGGRENSASVLELIEIISRKLAITPKISYEEKARTGDHICYITDYSAFQKDYPRWEIERNLNSIIDELIAYEREVHVHP